MKGTSPEGSVSEDLILTRFKLSTELPYPVVFHPSLLLDAEEYLLIGESERTAGGLATSNKNPIEEFSGRSAPTIRAVCLSRTK